MMQQKIGDFDESDFTFNAGVKLNVDFGSNFLFGYKGNIYLFDKENAIQNN
ncbi:MAG: hypothetical protein Q4G27_02170 [Flavobacteriaceae bacterium]|nr:hypothetical protein [Flavobacteriaceae bacterium]